MTERIASREQAEGYIALVCFKHGPPTLQGLELEWTVHHESDLRRPLEADVLRQALGSLAPPTLHPPPAAPASPAHRLARGSSVTVEPGGQLEISSEATSSVAALVSASRSDTAQLRSILADRGLRLGERAADAHRPPLRLLHTPRYDALEASFDAIGPCGRQMMNSTASLQICLDAGDPAALRHRWRAVHTLGPPLVALFANSPRLNGEPTGWASSRLGAILAMSPSSTTPPRDLSDPVSHWGRLCLDVPLVCLRRSGRAWTPPAGMTFADWVAAGSGDHGPAPTYDDLDYHLTTLFPVVRPRGYLEIRYLDQQPADQWVAPVALMCALLATPETVDDAISASEPAADRWVEAARDGLADPVVARAAARVVDVGLAAMSLLDLEARDLDEVTERLCTLTAGAMAGKDTR